jgi:hypothetical protein
MKMGSEVIELKQAVESLRKEVVRFNGQSNLSKLDKCI